MQLTYRFLFFANVSLERNIAYLREAGHECVILSVQSREQFLQDAKLLTRESGFDAIVSTSPGAFALGRFDEGLLSAFTPQLKLLASVGAGYDHVDINYLTSKGVIYANTPVAVSDPTATTATMLILQTVRAASQAEASLRSGRWSQGLERTPDVRDLTVGLIGLGRIGQLVKRKVEALGMTVIYHTRRRLPPSEEGGAKYVSLDELLRTADVISLHLPLTDESRHLLSDREFSRMKDGVFIVNTARGAIIDEAALVRAMKSNKVKRVGLDVFEHEPKVDPWLMQSDRASLLPHWAPATTRIAIDVEKEAFNNLKSWLATGHPNTPVNKISNSRS